MKLHTLSTKDPVYRYYKSVVIPFAEPRKVLSTSVYNGGYREDLTAVFNHDCNPGNGMPCELRAPTYDEHMRLIAREIGLEPDTASGMGTAASMENVAIRVESYKNLTVTAIVTGGVEVNGGRVGDPADYFQPIEKSTLKKTGTINIILVIDSDMPPGTMARALVTCTEAKTAALQELMAGSNYSNGLATGSGTDQTIVVANPQSELYLESAGKHAKLGELIGLAVKAAVKEALEKQTRLSPQKQHSMLRRFKRFGLTEESLWQRYQQANEKECVIKAEFINALYAIERRSEVVTYGSLFIHLLDQKEWRLLDKTETASAAEALLRLVSTDGTMKEPILHGRETKDLLTAWSTVMLDLTEEQLAAASQEDEVG